VQYSLNYTALNNRGFWGKDALHAGTKIYFSKHDSSCQLPSSYKFAFRNNFAQFFGVG